MDTEKLWTFAETLPDPKDRQLIRDAADEIERWRAREGKMMPYVDEDCEDQGMLATHTCQKCRLTFTSTGKPLCPVLEIKEGCWCCPLCGASYGKDAHGKDKQEDA